MGGIIRKDSPDEKKDNYLINQSEMNKIVLKLSVREIREAIKNGEIKQITDISPSFSKSLEQEISYKIQRCLT